MEEIKETRTAAQVLDTLLKSYRRYYNVLTEGVEPPFDAEAVFHSHDEQYFLLKSARLAEADSHEYVFFASRPSLDLKEVQALVDTAWQRGISRVCPHMNHRSSDVALILLADKMDPDAMEYIKKVKRYQSYRFTLHGWSSFQTVAMETSTGNLTCNRRGRDLVKLFRNIKK